MHAWHQKTSLDGNMPLNIFIAEDTEFPPHWHDAVEVVYMLKGNLKICVNNEVYELDEGDILLIESGDIHYFLPLYRPAKRIILHFETTFFEPLTSAFSNKRFTHVALKKSLSQNDEKESLRVLLEKQLFEMLDESTLRQEGYKLALRARLFDILVILLRNLPREPYSFGEKKARFGQLERLNRVFEFIDKHYDQHITLEQVAKTVNFSVYYFTRFFKEATGMTFGQYLVNIRISMAADFLGHEDIPITEVAFKSGFQSLKSFNRNFKMLKGCTPSQYRKSNI
jgi:AraC-like DNA-binding protein